MKFKYLVMLFCSLFILQINTVSTKSAKNSARVEKKRNIKLKNPSLES